MKKKNKCLCLAIVIVILVIAIYYIDMSTVDTRYAMEFSKVLNDYDINKLDNFLNGSTKIIYNEQSTCFKDVRQNVVKAFDEKKFEIKESSSYGHGDNKFINNRQTVSVLCYVKVEEKSYEVYAEMIIKKIGFNMYQIESLESDADFFGYLFYGERKPR